MNESYYSSYLKEYLSKGSLPATDQYYMYASVSQFSGLVQLQSGVVEAPPVVIEPPVRLPHGTLKRPPVPSTPCFSIKSVEPPIVVVIFIVESPHDKAVVIVETALVHTAVLRISHPGPIAVLVEVVLPGPAPIPALVLVVLAIVKLIAKIVNVRLEVKTIKVKSIVKAVEVNSKTITVLPIKTGPVCSPSPPPHLVFCVVIFTTAIVSPPRTVVQAIEVRRVVPAELLHSIKSIIVAFPVPLVNTKALQRPVPHEQMAGFQSCDRSGVPFQVPGCGAFPC